MSEALTDEELEEIEGRIGDLAARSTAATAARLAAESPPPNISPSSRRMPRRFIAYGAAAAAAVVVIVAVAAIRQPDTEPTETVAPPTTVSTTPLPTDGAPIEPIDAQVEADRLIAAEFGLTIGLPSDVPTPDLAPIIEGDTVAGYFLVEDRSAFPDAHAFVTYGPDGFTIVGVWGAADGFVPISDNPPIPPSVGTAE